MPCNLSAVTSTFLFYFFNKNESGKSHKSTVEEIPNHTNDVNKPLFFSKESHTGFEP